MNGKEASDWAEEFKGKDLTYFKDYNRPQGLNFDQLLAHKAAWQQAKWACVRKAREAADAKRARVDAEKTKAEFASAAAELRKSGHLLGESGKSSAPAAASAALVAAPAPLEPLTAEIIPPPSLVRPAGDAAQQLEHQLGTCSALIGNIANYIARNDANIDVCLNFMDRITSMMRSSAAAGKVVGKLRGDGPEETRHRVIVEHAAPRGEGVLRA